MFAPLSSYTESFDREQGFSLAEWRLGLPAATAPHPLTLAPDGLSATIALAEGELRLAWTEEPPRRIALVRMPRLAVQFRFHNVPADLRIAFMRRFDSVMLRGGG